MAPRRKLRRALRSGMQPSSFPRRTATSGCATPGRSLPSRRRRRCAPASHQQLGRQVRASRRRHGRRRDRRASLAQPCAASTSCSKAARSTTTAQGTVLTTRQYAAQPQPQRLDQGARPRRRCARRSAPARCIWIDEGLQERPHRWPHRQHGALRGARPRRVPGACGPPTIPTPRSQRHRAHARGDDRCRRPQARGRAHSRSPASIAMRRARSSPASHMNFVIANGVVVVPVYGNGRREVAALAALAVRVSRPQGGRRTVARAARLRHGRRRLVPLHHPAGTRCDDQAHHHRRGHSNVLRP